MYKTVVCGPMSCVCPSPLQNIAGVQQNVLWQRLSGDHLRRWLLSPLSAQPPSSGRGELRVPRNDGSRSGQKSACAGVSTYTTLRPGYSTVSSKLQSGSATRSANCLKIGWDVTQSCGLRCTFFFYPLLWGLGIEHPIRVIQSNMTGLPRIYVWRQRHSDSFCHIPAFKFRSRLFSPPRWPVIMWLKVVS